VSQSVSKSQFKSKALEYFRQVETTGKSLVITDRGRPVLKLVPFAEDPAEVLRELRHSVLRYESPTEPVATEDWESLK
jgi:prevent-host-death family protein